MKHASVKVFFRHPEGRDVFRRGGLGLSLVALSVVLALNSLSTCAQQPRPTEYAVKAAYLYNFGKFVDWPTKIGADRDKSFAICVLGKDPFGATLDATLANQTIDGRGVVAKRVASSQEALDCRILFISSSESGQLKDILATLDKSGVLTVSDSPQFSQRGGMIQFVADGNKVRFEVNLTNTENAGLTLSSELLKVAVAVRRNT